MGGFVLSCSFLFCDQVLAARLCPPGIEGTLFAFLMSLSNAGTNTSELLGAGLIKMVRVTTTNFEYLWLAVTIRSLMKLLPILFLFLVPRGNPADFDTTDVGKTKPSVDNGIDMEEIEAGSDDTVQLVQKR